MECQYIGQKASNIQYRPMLCFIIIIGRFSREVVKPVLSFRICRKPESVLSASVADSSVSLHQARNQLHFCWGTGIFWEGKEQIRGGAAVHRTVSDVAELCLLRAIAVSVYRLKVAVYVGKSLWFGEVIPSPEH